MIPLVLLFARKLQRAFCPRDPYYLVQNRAPSSPYSPFPLGHSWMMAAGSAFFLPFPSSSAAAPAHRQLYSGLQQPAARGPAQAVPGHVPSPQNLFLGTAIIVGFTYFLLSVVSLMLRGFVSPKGSSCSLFPLESKGWIIWLSLLLQLLNVH